MFEPKLSQRQEFHEYMKERMEEVKEDFLAVISSNLNPQLIERMISCVAYSYFDDYDDAITIYHDLKLNIQHLNAAMNEEKEFGCQLWRDIEDGSIETL